uniref:2-hydroxyflavanone C-arabinosyltransferase n=1 Tax=Arisaema erubescens TaxID=228806 RepID=A0A859N7A4_9ARAE|nr:2-hydroxyflavanone C-arabinosyltransferase [Arisaema erubescens]
MSREQQSSSSNGGLTVPHVAVIPSAGMGHLSISVRLAATLASHGCLVTFITPRPVVSDAESRTIADLHSSYPQIRSLDLRLLPFDAPDVDPFLRQFEVIRRSASLLQPLLTSVTPPLSAVIVDISLLSTFVPVTKALRLPTYVTFISCAMMLALLAVFPSVRKAAGDGPIAAVDIPGVGTSLPGSWIPPPLHDPKHLFAIQFLENGEALLQADGVFINTFSALEAETLAALNAGNVVPGLPPVIAIGPQQPVKFEGAKRAAAAGRDEWAAWLDAQPPGSVLYVAFGNRTALPREQLRELGLGLEKSGCRFLWVVKSKIVDREDDAGVLLEDLLGEGYRERVGERGMVVKSWVDQEEVLAHPSVGGFLSHAGWNSVAEAALQGICLFGWPAGGDQRVAALVVEKCGAGAWVKEWGWSGSGRGLEETPTVSGEEIGKRLRELMGDASLRESTARIRKDALRSVGVGGKSYEAVRSFIAGLGGVGYTT